jgi:hypothetical protein
MFSFVALLVYLVAMAVPACLLFYFGSGPWYWHAAAIAMGLAMGFIPIPQVLSQPASDLVIGFVFVFLLAWGIGGLFMVRPHRAKHA